MDPRYPSNQTVAGQQGQHQGYPNVQVPQAHAQPMSPAGVPPSNIPVQPPAGFAAPTVMIPASPYEQTDTQTHLSPGPQNTPQNATHINPIDPSEHQGTLSLFAGCCGCLETPIQEDAAAKPMSVQGQNPTTSPNSKRRTFWSCCFGGSEAPEGSNPVGTGQTVGGSKPEVMMGPPPTQAVFGPYLRFGGYNPETRQWRISVLLIAHQTKCPTAPSLHFKEGHVHVNEGTITGSFLDQYQGWYFWRFNLVVECGPSQRVVKYKVTLPTDHHYTHHKKYHIVVPSATQSWHWGFYSCNGFHQPELEEKTKGIQPLWRDVLYVHEQNPIHMMVGGGDQLYNDGVWQSPTLKTWVSLPDIEQRYSHPFTQEMTNEVNDFYFRHYLTQWSQAVFRDALAMIPQAMMWDDHDIFDGWGSYPAKLQNCDVFQGIYKIARKFYTLFQQHSTPERMREDNGVFGPSGWHMLTCLGPSTALLLMDNRSERSLNAIMAPGSYEEFKTRLLNLPATVKHVIVVSTVPMIYPKLPVVEAALTYLQRGAKDRTGIVAMLQKTGLADSIMDQFGTVEILDDLQDHWGADTHTQEKLDFVHLLQSIALRRSFRFNILSGDVHVAGVGRFLSEPKQNLKTDYRYMPQIISSAIGNVPPPDGVVKALSAFATPKMLDPDTKETMVNVFGVQKTLCAARNWLIVGEVPYNNGGPDVPGSLIYQFRVEAGQMGSNLRPETYEVEVPPLELPPGMAQPAALLPGKPTADYVHAGSNATYVTAQGNAPTGLNAPAGAYGSAHVAPNMAPSPAGNGGYGHNGHASMPSNAYATTGGYAANVNPGMQYGAQVVSSPYPSVRPSGGSAA